MLAVQKKSTMKWFWLNGVPKCTLFTRLLSSKLPWQERRWGFDSVNLLRGVVNWSGASPICQNSPFDNSFSKPVHSWFKKDFGSEQNLSEIEIVSYFKHKKKHNFEKLISETIQSKVLLLYHCQMLLTIFVDIFIP